MITSFQYWGFLALGVPIFWALPTRYRYGFLGGISWAFLFSVAPETVISLSLWIAAFYYLAPQVVAGRRRPAWVGVGLILGIIGFLIYNKYMPAISESLIGDSAGGRLLLLLGISYYTFKLIHYAIEVGRGSIQDRSFQQFFCYMFLAPIFTAGPIERFDHFLNNQEAHFSTQSMADGLTRIMYGLIKKFVILQMLIIPAFGEVTSAEIVVGKLTDMTTIEVWTFFILTYLAIYVDFSAYSDIAIGSSRLFGIRIMENFNWPILATNIVNFWQRWHMTLRGWCQSYIYMPTLGYTRNPYLAIYATFLVMGLWHAGSMGRVAWGLYHGTGIVTFILWSRLKRHPRWVLLGSPILRVAGWPITFLFVSGSFVFSETEYMALSDSLRLLLKLVFVDIA